MNGPAGVNPSPLRWFGGRPCSLACDVGEGVCRLITLNVASDRLKGFEGVHCWSKVVLTSFHCGLLLCALWPPGQHEAEQGVDFVYFIMISVYQRLPGTC
jgi:hypothetical protein